MYPSYICLKALVQSLVKQSHTFYIVVSTCPEPDEKIISGSLIKSNESNRVYKKGDDVLYNCDDPSNNRQAEATCNGTHWNYPHCIGE